MKGSYRAYGPESISLSLAMLNVRRMEFADYVQTLCIPGYGIDKSLVTVEWSQNFCRQSLEFIDHNIEKAWNEKCISCPAIWNGSKFRLHQTQLHKESDCLLPRVKLLLGPTCYKDSMGTNCYFGSTFLFDIGMIDHDNSQAYMSDPLGVGALILTEDNDIIFIRRSSHCAEFPCMIDRPGGHPEPDNVTAKAGTDLQNIDPSLILEEIFNSVLEEVTEEVNIPLENLSSPLLLGISYNPDTMRMPSLEFYLKCNLSTDEVKDLYTKRTENEIEESTELIIIPVKEVLDNDLEKLKYYKELTFGAKGVIYFFKVFSSK